MQAYERDNYKKKLADSILNENNEKNLTVHYYFKKNVWALMSEDKEVHGIFDDPEAIIENVEVGNITNADEFDAVLKYRKNSKFNESTETEQKLFFMDTIYGKDGHNLRESLRNEGSLPGSEMSLEEIMDMLGDNTEHPDAVQPDSQFAQGHGSLEETLKMPLTEMSTEQLYEVCSESYENMMEAMKGLHHNCQYEAQKRFFRELYEMQWDARKKTIEACMKKVQEEMHGNQQPVDAPQEPMDQPTEM